MIDITIFEQARELGEAILKTEEYKRYAMAEIAQSSDEEAMALVNAYNEKRRELGKRISMDNPTKEEIEEIRAELNAEFDKLRANAVVNEYIEANKAYSEMAEQINNIINMYISGGESSSCSGSCSGCSGCSH